MEEVGLTGYGRILVISTIILILTLVLVMAADNDVTITFSTWWLEVALIGNWRSNRTAG